MTDSQLFAFTGCPGPLPLLPKNGNNATCLVVKGGVVDQTAPMRLLGQQDSRAALQRTTGMVVERLLERREHEDVRAICGRLERLKIEAA